LQLRANALECGNNLAKKLGDNMKYPHVNVEEWFTEMVRHYPMGCVVTDIIKSPDFPNADFVFHHEKVVAELKRIEIDNVNSANNQAKIDAALEKFFAEGKIKTKEITEENWRSLPWDLQCIYYDIVSNSIKGHVEKANKQIKATKEKLNLNSYKGVLIIANDGVQSLPPAAFNWAVFRLLRNHYSGITSFIFFTANVFAKTKAFPMPMQYWLGSDMEKDGKMDTQLSISLHEAWKSIVCQKTGMRGATIDMKDEDVLEGLWNARNLPR
jgi:hypothetical protein